MMYLFIKYVCERCYLMYKEELEKEGWSMINKVETKEGICSICGRIEGKRTLLEMPQSVREILKGSKEER